MAATDFPAEEGNEIGAKGIRILRLVPGGAQPGREELATGLLVLAALAWIILVRKGFKGALPK